MVFSSKSAGYSFLHSGHCLVSSNSASLRHGRHIMCLQGSSTGFFMGSLHSLHLFPIFKKCLLVFLLTTCSTFSTVFMVVSVLKLQSSFNSCNKYYYTAVLCSQDFTMSGQRKKNQSNNSCASALDFVALKFIDFHAGEVHQIMI